MKVIYIQKWLSDKHRVPQKFLGFVLRETDKALLLYYPGDEGTTKSFWVAKNRVMMADLNKRKKTVI